MINSISKKLFSVEILKYEGEIKMLPFKLNDLSNILDLFKSLIQDLISFLPNKEGIAYLTVDSRTINQNETHRRGGLHIDGNFIPTANSWGNSGWKVCECGQKLTSEQHKLSYCTPNHGGMIIVSDYSACLGCNGQFDEEPKIGGDCSHVKIQNSFILEPNIAYYGSSQFLHESLPIKEKVHGTLVRITLPSDYPVLN